MHILNLLPHGPLPYMDIDALQRSLHDAVAHGKAPDTFIMWEAQDTYTAGRRTKDEDIPNKNVPVIPMDRGGSVTYHGPGQVVIYPIIHVTNPPDVVAFVRAVERAVMSTLRRCWNIESVQIPGRSGVWICKEGEIDRKICAIGIKFAEDTTMHGIAFNVNTDLDMFGQIVPCGLSDAFVASLEYLGITGVTLEECGRQLAVDLAHELEQFRLHTDEEEASPHEALAFCLAHSDTDLSHFANDRIEEL